MRAICAGLICITLVILVLSGGCISNPSTGMVTNETITVTPTEFSTSVTTAIPQVTLTEFPPDALNIGEYARFGLGEEKPGKASVVSYRIVDQYEWGNTFWGNRYFNATPKEGNRFLILFIRVANTGTKPIFAPSPAVFTVVSNGTTYKYSSVDDPTLWIKGIEKKQLDYAILEERRDGYLNADSNNVIDGYLIYEVPLTFTKGYVDATFNGSNHVSWKIG